MNVEKAMKRARIATENRYEDTCDIIEIQNVYDETSKKTTPNVEVKVYENQPCFLSHKTVTNNSETDTGAIKTQIIELFVSPDITIKPGSKIVVTHKGIETAYKNSGEIAIFPTQQTVILELFDEWS